MVFVWALSSLALVDLNRIATTDNRLIRRIVRDHRTRGNSATATLRRWESVRRGEDKHIFPNQEQADVMFNSSLFYELAVLKDCVWPLLREVTVMLTLSPSFASCRTVCSTALSMCTNRGILPSGGCSLPETRVPST